MGAQCASARLEMEAVDDTKKSGQRLVGDVDYETAEVAS